MANSLKPNLLFISFCMPCPTGGGSRMRAYNILLALSSSFTVDLLVFHAGLRQRPPRPQPALTKICASITVCARNPVHDRSYWLRAVWKKVLNRLFISWTSRFIEIHPQLTPRQQENLHHYFRGKHFAVIHLFRLAMYPLFRTFSESVSFDRLQLDLDDIESENWSRISELHRLNSNSARALQAKRGSAIYRKLEENILPSVDRVIVCSEHDKSKIENLYTCQQVTVFPNIYPIPEIRAHKAIDQKIRLLFVGLAGYPPNTDAILYFCGRILPELRQKTTNVFELQIITGGKMPGQIRKKIAKESDIAIIGWVDDVGPYYQQADIVVIPLRAGSGTRIKALEAFARQVPVVSTSIGVEGLEVEHGEHALIADTPGDFAEQCQILMNNPTVGKTLAENAYSLVKTRYSPARLTRIVSQIKQ